MESTEELCVEGEAIVGGLCVNFWAYPHQNVCKVAFRPKKKAAPNPLFHVKHVIPISPGAVAVHLISDDYEQGFAEYLMPIVAGRLLKGAFGPVSRSDRKECLRILCQHFRGDSVAKAVSRWEKRAYLKTAPVLSETILHDSTHARIYFHSRRLEKLRAMPRPMLP